MQEIVAYIGPNGSLYAKPHKGKFVWNHPTDHLGTHFVPLGDEKGLDILLVKISSPHSNIML